ncbi:MAG: hypothetical protein QOK89_09060 [Nitrososphaeraceae archaeon]|nr:hypothetical protein [Nitrososphaeraceae archaeon]
MSRKEEKSKDVMKMKIGDFSQLIHHRFLSVELQHLSKSVAYALEL